MNELTNNELIELMAMSRRFAELYGKKGLVDITGYCGNPEIQLTPECFKSFFGKYEVCTVSDDYSRLSQNLYGISFIALERKSLCAIK